MDKDSGCDQFPRMTILTPGFTAGLQHSVTHRVTAAELAPVAALIGSDDPALTVRAAGTLMTRLLLTRFPGPGSRLLREDYSFFGGLAEGDTLEIEAEVESSPDPNRMRIGCRVRHEGGETILIGTAEMSYPAVSQADTVTPFSTQPRRMLAALLKRCRSLPPVPTAVAHPATSRACAAR